MHYKDQSRQKTGNSEMMCSGKKQREILLLDPSAVNIDLAGWILEINSRPMTHQMPEALVERTAASPNH